MHRYAHDYAAAVRDLHDKVLTAEDSIAEAGRLIAECVLAGGVVHAFGTGHSQAVAMEIAGRAGGLVPTNRLALTDLVLYGGRPPAALHDVLLERETGLAGALLELTPPSPHDVLIIISNSGINASVVEMALEARRRSLAVIAVTSVSASLVLPVRHPSGTRLLDHADVVLDNAAPEGDAVLTLADGSSACGVSSMTSTLLVQCAVADAIGRLEAAGADVPIYRSANVPRGHERNVELEKRYAGRIRRGAS